MNSAPSNRFLRRSVAAHGRTALAFEARGRRLHSHAVTPPPAPRNFAKPFSIAGFIAAEIYMIFVVLGPNTAGVETPLWANVARLLIVGIFLGLFGALAGLGAGLLVTAIANKLRR